MHDPVDPELDDMRRMTPAEKAVAAIAMMRDGIEMKRMQIRRARPTATGAEVEAALLAWLADDRAV